MENRNKILLSIVLLSIAVGVGVGLLMKRKDSIKAMKKNGYDALGLD